MAKILKIKCVSNDNNGLALTIGKDYQLDHVDKYGNIHVKNDEWNITAFSNTRFDTKNIVKEII